eukprot:6253069-Prymnesium_polylepis.2
MRAILLHQLPADGARCEHKYQCDGPRRAQHYTPVIVAKTRTCKEDVLELGRHLEEIGPLRIFLQTQRRLYSEDAGNRRKTLIKAHQRLDFALHPRCLPHFPGAAGPSDHCTAPDRGLAPVDRLDKAKGSEHQEKQSTRHGRGPSGDVTAVAAARIELVKVHGAGRLSTKLASQPAVAWLAAVSYTHLRAHETLMNL